MDTRQALTLPPWGAENPTPAELFAPTVSHPAFAAAAMSLALNMLPVIDRDRVLDSVLKDAGRYVVAMCALNLHARDGLTLPKLKAICVKSRLLSPGRARILLQYLEHVGFVSRSQPLTTPVRYLPTAAFVSAWRPHLRVALEAASLVEPQIALVLARYDDPVVAEAFHCHHAEALLTSISEAQDYPLSNLMHVFLHAYAGSQILSALLACSEGGEFPPQRAGPVAIAALSRRFGVSRAHVRRLFDDADRKGLMRLQPDGMVVFEAAAREELVLSYGGQLAHLIAAAAKTARELGQAQDARRPNAAPALQGAR